MCLYNYCDIETNIPSPAPQVSVECDKGNMLNGKMPLCCPNIGVHLVPFKHCICAANR